MRLAALLALTGLVSTAEAWESVCYDSATHACNPSAGPQTARQRWVGFNDEHRQLFEAALTSAGLPGGFKAEQTMVAYTSDALVHIGGADWPTLQPVTFERALRTQPRTFTIAELAQLPDFSFALWDWVSGNELCPLGDGTDTVLCHDFGSHMGPVNSNHFVPQAAGAYARLHATARARAAACRAMADRVASEGDRFRPFVEACEVEALALEAVAQHFLQDAWSMGHMWQRWGSPRLSDFPGANTDEQRSRAVLVALVSGFIHGARGVLQALPNWSGYDVDDAMCAPWDDVQFVTADGALVSGVGDDYLPALAGEQARRLAACAASGVLDVYQATAMVHGPAQPSAGLASVDPTSDACFGQRATNAAMVRGMAIQLKLGEAQVQLPIDARFASWMVPQVARTGGKSGVSPALRNEFRVGVQRVSTRARLVAKDDPLGTSLANGGLGDLLGVHPNGQYTSAADYEDPALPWAVDGAPRAASLATLFHRAHASDGCAAVDAAGLDRVRAHARDSALDLGAQAAACEACVELAARHLRVGTATSWDTAHEPLCHFLTPSPAYLYATGAGGTEALARAWCCP